MNELWELVLANSLSGIHKFKIVYSVYRFVGPPELSSFDGPVTNFLFQMKWGPSSNPKYFFMRTSLGA
jgi:hypothetical protein